tara:strand:+ start:1496 stop:1747 length:252 start_codon:yes stop_codon:yes gene_type:complete
MKMVNEDVKTLFERFQQIDNEIALLREDKKEILEEFKDRVEPKVFRAALASAKRKAKLKPQESNDYDQVLLMLENELCIEHIE